MTSERGDGSGSTNGSARQRQSLVDSAEQALRNWMAPGRYRPGDRLPPEHDVAEMLGVSRGTLRTALQRLQDTGEIVRRQGSGTFVGRVAMPIHLDQRLERLEPYSSLAKRRQLTLTATKLRIEQRAVGSEVGELLELDEATSVTTIFRVLLASGEPAAVMFDVVHPSVELPEARTLLRRLEGGQMVLDVLIDRGIPIGFARTRVMPCLVTPREKVGKALQIHRTTASLELEEVIYLVVPPGNSLTDSRAKIEHGKDAGFRRSSATSESEDAARRRFAAANRQRICGRCP